MKGITDSAILLVVGVIVLIIVVGAFLVAVTQQPQSSGGSVSIGGCSDNGDCTSSPDGPWCAQVYSGEGLSDTKCICYRNADCEGGYECADSKCRTIE
ncbi:MAG TPA: hypothetical protein VJH90_02675 [archaeon]|nr:hypothetical protein [archaeon]